MDHRQLSILVIVVVLVILVAFISYLLIQRQRSRKLRERFGPEYDRTVKQEGDRRRAEGVLEMREKRRDKFKLLPLSASTCSEFEARWKAVQAKFVDDPKESLVAADQLISELMQARGYPVADFDQRAADVSVDHPVVVDNYRVGHNIVARHRQGQASTEDLRKAMVHYRALFDELLRDALPRKKATA